MLASHAISHYVTVTRRARAPRIVALNTESLVVSVGVCFRSEKVRTHVLRRSFMVFSNALMSLYWSNLPISTLGCLYSVSTKRLKPPGRCCACHAAYTMRYGSRSFDTASNCSCVNVSPIPASLDSSKPLQRASFRYSTLDRLRLYQNAGTRPASPGRVASTIRRESH